MLSRLTRASVASAWLARVAQSPVRHAYSATSMTLNLADFPPERIRNFSIIAHIDHGKSTLADRLMEITGCIKVGAQNQQILDKLQVERERGITVKAQSVSMFHSHKGQKYLLNLIDTPGHVDFSYEVSRSLAACQGALLLVDASKGIQAQTSANFFLAFEQNLNIIPVLNKIDVDFVDAEKVAKDIENAFELSKETQLRISAKTGLNCDSVLDAVIERIPPPPPANPQTPFRALLFDSVFTERGGTVCLLYVVDGSVAPGDKIYSCASGRKYDVREVGINTPEPQMTKRLSTGQVGYVILGMKTCSEARVGDTFAKFGHEVTPLPGFQPAKPVVFCSVFPKSCNDLLKLGDSIEKLLLNDSSVTVQSEVNTQLGRGYRLGFLGTLHMDVIQQRLEQEHGTNVVLTEPTVPFRVVYSDGTSKVFESPVEFQKQQTCAVLRYEEPMIKATIVAPEKYLKDLAVLCDKYRGIQIDLSYLLDGRAQLVYRLPMMETVKDFYSRIKALSSGFATLDYELDGFAEADLKCVNVIINGNVFEPLTTISHASNVKDVGKDLVTRVRKHIERQFVPISVHVVDGKNVLARDKIGAIKRDGRTVSSKDSGMKLSYSCLVNLVQKTSA